MLIYADTFVTYKILLPLAIEKRLPLCHMFAMPLRHRPFCWLLPLVHVPLLLICPRFHCYVTLPLPAADAAADGLRWLPPVAIASYYANIDTFPPHYCCSTLFHRCWCCPLMPCWYSLPAIYPLLLLIITIRCWRPCRFWVAGALLQFVSCCHIRCCCWCCLPW